jgi:hypothetical protein
VADSLGAGVASGVFVIVTVGDIKGITGGSKETESRDWQEEKRRNKHNKRKVVNFIITLIIVM